MSHTAHPHQIGSGNQPYTQRCHSPPRQRAVTLPAYVSRPEGRNRLPFRSFSNKAELRTRQERHCDEVHESVLSEYCVNAHHQHPEKRLAPLTRPIQVLAVYPRSAHPTTLRVGESGAVSVTVKHKPMPNPTVEYTTLPWVSNVWMPRLIFTASKVPAAKGLMVST